MSFTDASHLMQALKREMSEARRAHDYPKADRMAHRIKVLRAHFRRQRVKVATPV